MTAAESGPGRRSVYLSERLSMAALEIPVRCHAIQDPAEPRQRLPRTLTSI